MSELPSESSPQPRPLFHRKGGGTHARMCLLRWRKQDSKGWLVSSQSLLLREQQARVQKKIIRRYRKFSIWKWLEKRSANHRLSGPRVLGEIFKWHTHGVKIFI